MFSLFAVPYGEYDGIWTARRASSLPAAAPWMRGLTCLAANSAVRSDAPVTFAASRTTRCFDNSRSPARRGRCRRRQGGAFTRPGWPSAPPQLLGWTSTAPKEAPGRHRASRPPSLPPVGHQRPLSRPSGTSATTSASRTPRCLTARAPGPQPALACARWSPRPSQPLAPSRRRRSGNRNRPGTENLVMCARVKNENAQRSLRRAQSLCSTLQNIERASVTGVERMKAIQLPAFGG